MQIFAEINFFVINLGNFIIIKKNNIFDEKFIIAVQEKI